MSATLDVGRLVMSGLPGRGLDAATARALESGKLGGLILFREAFETLEQARATIEEARARARWPILVGVDEEGGLVSQIDGVPLGEDLPARGAGAPSPRSLAELGHPELTEAAHELVARVLAGIGVDIAFAPCLDVNVDENPVIGRRAFGDDAGAVSTHGTAALRGLARGGVMGCAKHFPGHGAAVADSHHELPVIDGTRDTISARDLPPFQAAIMDGVPLVMVAHAHVPALDPVPAPATCSSAVIDGLLRGTLGFDGVVVSDALEMRGFESGTALPPRIHRALGAGVNLFLCARDPVLAEEVHAALVAHAADDTGARERVRRSLAAVERLVNARPRLSAPDALGRAVAEAGEILPGLHLRATRVDGELGRGPHVIVCPDLPRPRHLDPDDVREAFASLFSGVTLVAYGAESPLRPDALPEMGSVFLVTLTRGRTPRPEAANALEVLRGWEAAATERRLGIFTCADDEPESLPVTWLRARLTGSHRSAFEAVARGLAGERPTG